MNDVQLIGGDCLAIMPTLEPNSVDTIITDPPYGLKFMGKAWDHGVPGAPFWAEALRVAKPGAMLLAFGGTRTWHRLAAAIEDGGWEMRDTLMWIYGQGFPKSHDISKAIDKAAGAERKAVRKRTDGRGKWNLKMQRDHGDTGIGHADGSKQTYMETAPATEAAALWDGWGTALKPAWEPIILAMKPIDGTFASNAQTWGVAGLNVDGGRIGGIDPANAKRLGRNYTTENTNFGGGQVQQIKAAIVGGNPAGRWPANVLFDEAAAAQLDAMSGERSSGGKAAGTYANSGKSGGIMGETVERVQHNHFEPSTGGASRFFYCAKASRAERNAGLDGMPEREQGQRYGTIQDARPNTLDGYEYPRKEIANNHPTVKPLALMRYLCRLTATPTGGIVLDPFMGSGSTGCAAVLEGRSFVGIELESDYLEIARRRIAHVQPLQPTLFDGGSDDRNA